MTVYLKKDLKLSDDDFECAVFDLLLAKCQTKYRIVVVLSSNDRS